MTKYLDLSAVEPMTDSLALSQEPDLPPTPKVFSNVAATSPATSYEGSTNTPPPLWRPSEPQFTKAIATYYGVSRKSVQQWFQKVKEACPWFADTDLKLPDERYTPLCIELMGSYRTAGLPFEAWKSHLWQHNPDLVAAYQAAQPETSPAPPAPPDTPAFYQRSEAIAALLSARPQIAAPPAPDQNPLVLALQQKVASLATTTLSVRQQLEQVRQMTADTQSAIQALEDLQVVERAQAKADRHYQLEQQVYTRRLEALGLDDVLGKSQNAQPQSA